VVILLSRSYWPATSAIRQAIEMSGYAAIVLCIVGRVWCSLYIGGRKSTEVVADGPYSAVRNPLYLFSMLGAAGIGAAHGSLLLAGLIGVGCYLLFRMIVLAEEQTLLARHGTIFSEYAARTPRFLPDPRLLRGIANTAVQPRFVAVTLLDGIWFLVAIPSLQTVKWLQAHYFVAPLVLP
jgi:protein-S-isoprenylcysteine O-methyltransferase Ste14